MNDHGLAPGGELVAHTRAHTYDGKMRFPATPPLPSPSLSLSIFVFSENICQETLL